MLSIMLQNLQYLKEFLSFLNLLDSFPLSHTFFPFLQLLSLPQRLTCGYHTSIQIYILHRTTEMNFCSGMTCDYLFSLALQDHTKKYPASCQLLVPKKQHVDRTINHRVSAKGMKSCRFSRWEEDGSQNNSEEVRGS